jgi:hypothetical protein
MLRIDYENISYIIIIIFILIKYFYYFIVYQKIPFYLMSSIKYTALMMADTNAIKLRAEENLPPPNQAQEIASPLIQSPDQEPSWANLHESLNY